MIFGSDNQAGASSSVLEEISKAYSSTQNAYGSDEYSAMAEEQLKQVFDTELKAYFVVSGTAANTLALSTMLEPWEGAVCHHQAHILLDESSGPSLFAGGASLLPVPSKSLKLIPDEIEHMLHRLPSDRPHNIKASALSLSQANEGGQVYTADEVSALCATAKSHGFKTHMDGARFANAVAAQDCHPADISWKAGVDVLCLGATKNGAVAAEAVIFFDQSLAQNFDYRLKRTGHLVSKGRLFGAQFVAWLNDNHWLDLATSANRHAELLRAEIRKSSHIRLAFETTSNESFIILPKHLFEQLLESGVSMYDWYADAVPEDCVVGDDEVLARMVTSFSTTTDQIESFIALVKSLA